MRNMLVLAAIILVALGFFGSSPVEFALRLIGNILSTRIRFMNGRRIVIIDGDTIRFRRGRLFGLLGHDIVRGRLRGIDAPESGQQQGPAATDALRKIIMNGGWHIAISCRHDVYERELMWLVGLHGPVGVRMLWKGHAFATTLLGMPVSFVAKLFRRGMWGKGPVTDPQTWRIRNTHEIIRAKGR